jgi:hypothetical protein
MSAITRVFAETAAQRVDRFGDMRRSYGEPFAHSLNSEMPTENHYDWTQDARRSSYNIDSLGNVCICASRNLRTGSFPGDVSQ